jgi:hypothetical protein
MAVCSQKTQNYKRTTFKLRIEVLFLIAPPHGGFEKKMLELKLKYTFGYDNSRHCS